jgi:hypothetical protein
MRLCLPYDLYPITSEPEIAQRDYGHDDEDQIGRAGAMVILGFWLAFEQGGPEPKMISAWSCAGSKALFCVQR